jgi:hypothetical protein
MPTQSRRLSLFLPEPTYQQNVLPRAEDEWMLDELDALVTDEGCVSSRGAGGS